MLLSFPLLQTYSVARVQQKATGGIKWEGATADLSLINNSTMNISSIREKTDHTQNILTADGPNNTTILCMSFNSNLLLFDNLLKKVNVFLVDHF